MLDEIAGRRLRVVERLAWHPDDDSLPELNVGSVHLWFDDGRCVHFDAASDWTLAWSISGPGDNDWVRHYDYECNGRWAIRDASTESSFEEAVGRQLDSVVPHFNEAGEVTGATLAFDGFELVVQATDGEISTRPG